MYLLGFCLDVVYAVFREIWSEWLLGVRRREHEKKGWRERKDGMGLQVEGQASIEGGDGPLRRF